MKKVILSLITSVCVLVSIAGAQSDPEPFNLNEHGKFSFTTWPADAPGGTYPSNMVFHIMGPEAPISLSSVAIDDVTGQYNLRAGTRINGLGEDGISLINMSANNSAEYPSNQLGEVVIGFNTKGRTRIDLDFTAGTIDRGTPGAESKLRVQFRVMRNGAWRSWREISPDPVEYTSSLFIPSEKIFSRIQLPESASNQENIQIRFLFYHSAGILDEMYRSPAIRLDNVKVTSVPLVSFNNLEACATNNSFPLTGGTPAGGIYSGNFVSGNLFNASQAGIGDHLVYYTYTDQNGISSTDSAIVTVGINNCTTQLTNRWCGASNLQLSDIINVIPVPGAVDYEYRFKNEELNFLTTVQRGSYLTNLYLNKVNGLKYGASYIVDVRFKMGDRWSEFGPDCVISMEDKIPVTSLAPQSCGAINLSLDDTLFVNHVMSASDYEYRFRGTDDFEVLIKRGTGLVNLFLNSVPGLKNGQTYSVDVRAQVAGEWAQFGEICDITLQSEIPTTQLAPQSCGATDLNMRSILKIIPVTGAEDYEFKFTNDELNFSVTIKRGTNLANMYLHFVPGLQHGRTYNVSVRAKVSGNWGHFGEECTITITDGIPLTELKPESCGATGLTMEDIIHAKGVPGADDYEFLFTNDELNFSVAIRRNTSIANMHLSMVPGLKYGHTYNVEVRANVGGNWGEFGKVCQITLSDDFPLTQLTPESCGATGLTMQDFIHAIPVAGADDYEFLFVCGTQPFHQSVRRGTNISNLPLRLVNGLLDNNTYLVQVRANVGGVWSEYGQACAITLGDGVSRSSEILTFDENGKNFIMNIFPNPSSGIFSFTTENENGFRVQIYNSHGQMVINQVSISPSTMIDMTSYSKGVYFVRIESSGKVFYDRIILSD